MAAGFVDPLDLLKFSLIGAALVVTVPIAVSIGVVAALVPLGCVATFVLRLKR